jgi:hypothetical protein
MKYCPTCNKEYEEKEEACPFCGEKLNEKAKQTEEIKYVPLRSLPSRLYAEMYKEALRNYGIPCIIKGDDIGIMLGSYGTNSLVEIVVWVPEDKKERAEEILNQMLNHI